MVDELKFSAHGLTKTIFDDQIHCYSGVDGDHVNQAHYWWLIELPYWFKARILLKSLEILTHAR